MTGAAPDPLDRTDMEAWGALTYERFVALVEIARAARDECEDHGINCGCALCYAIDPFVEHQPATDRLNHD